MKFDFKNNNFAIAIYALGATVIIALIVILIYVLRPRDNAGSEYLPILSDSAAFVDENSNSEIKEPRVEVEDPASDTATVIDLDTEEDDDIDRKADMKINAELNMLADNSRRLVSRMGQLRNAGTLDVSTFNSLKSQIIEIKDRQIELASTLSDGAESAAAGYRREKEELISVFTRMEVDR